MNIDIENCTIEKNNNELHISCNDENHILKKDFNYIELISKNAHIQHEIDIHSSNYEHYEPKDGTPIEIARRDIMIDRKLSEYINIIVDTGNCPCTFLSLLEYGNGDFSLEKPKQIQVHILEFKTSEDYQETLYIGTCGLTTRGKLIFRLGIPPKEYDHLKGIVKCGLLNIELLIKANYYSNEKSHSFLNEKDGVILDESNYVFLMNLKIEESNGKTQILHLQDSDTLFEKNSHNKTNKTKPCEIKITTEEPKQKIDYFNKSEKLNNTLQNLIGCLKVMIFLLAIALLLFCFKRN